MFELRYYAPHYKQQTHETILSLLQQIQATHNIPFKIRELRYQKSEYSNDNLVYEQDEKEIYEKDFLPQKFVLRKRIGESIRRLLRSRSGHYFIGGTIAITRAGQIEWFTNYANPFKEYDEDPSIGFLKALLNKGPILLVQLCPKIEKVAPELEMLNAFRDSGVLKGEFKREVKVGKRLLKTERGVLDWRKSIDLVCEKDNEIWIIEGKNRLNYQAVGEVLTYVSLYSEEFPEKKIRLGIVCSIIDEDILKTCKKYNITVFQLIGKEVKIYPA